MSPRAAAALLFPALACAATPGPSPDVAASRSPSRGTHAAIRSRPTPRAPDEPAASRDRETGALVGITAAHNAVRKGVGVGPLVWSSELAAHAQEWADHLAASGCNLQHRPPGGDAFGENIFWSSGGATPASVVAEWTAERSGYDHAKNRCRGVCGHYTQVVWRRSERLGCGVARCDGAELWVCNYDPPGNFVGESPY